MPLWEPANCPHVVDVYRPSSSADAGGGTGLSYTLLTAGVRGILASATSAEKEMFAQLGLTVTHTFAAAGDSPAARGDKLVYGTRSLRVVGINVNDPIGTLPQLTRLTLEEIL